MKWIRYCEDTDENEFLLFHLQNSLHTLLFLPFDFLQGIFLVCRHNYDLFNTYTVLKNL